MVVIDRYPVAEGRNHLRGGTIFSLCPSGEKPLLISRTIAVVPKIYAVFFGLEMLLRYFRTPIYTINYGNHKISTRLHARDRGELLFGGQCCCHW